MSEVAIAEIQKAIADKKHIFGTDVLKKKLPSGKVKKVYMTSNCSKQIEEDINHYAKLSQVAVEKLALTNDELSILCKKPFLVNVVSILQ